MMIAIPLDTLMVRLGNTFIDNGAQRVSILKYHVAVQRNYYSRYNSAA